MHASTLKKSITSEITETDLAFSAETLERNNAGEPVPAARFPKEMRPLFPDGRIPKLTDIFCAGGYWVVSARFAEVMQRCDIGRTAFYPVSFFQSDMKTRVEGDFFHLNFAKIKTAFELDKSLNATPFSPGVWRPAIVPKDGEIAVSKSALKGVDLWIDPGLRRSVFMSDRLVQQLKNERLARRLGLAKCNIV